MNVGYYFVYWKGNLRYEYGSHYYAKYYYYIGNHVNNDQGGKGVYHFPDNVRVEAEFKHPG